MVTLDRLTNVLSGYGARLHCESRIRSRELRSVALRDVTDPEPSADVLLGVGVRESELVGLLESVRAVVVVLRCTELDPATVALAQERGVAVISVDPAVSWGQLAGVIFGLVLEGRETEAGRGPTDLFGLADVLAESVGGPVTIEDHHSGVLAYSRRQQAADRARLETILGRRVPEELRRKLAEQGVFSHLASSEEPLFVRPLPGGLDGRVVIAVRAGRELLGSIWVETQRPLDESHHQALVDGARTATVHLLRARASADLERQVESDLVLGLLEGDLDPASGLSRLGLHAAPFRVVAVQARTDEEHGASALVAFERATQGFGWTRSGRSGLFANTVYTILPCGDDPEPATAWVRGLVAALPAGISAVAGVGGVADETQLMASRQEADESVALHATEAATSAVVYDESWHDILLRRLRAVAAAGRVPTRGPVARLREHDRKQGTRYVQTLRAWLECQGDLGAAASRLGVHANTVRYRVRKMSELTDLDADTPDKRLALIVALAVGDPGAA